MLPSIYLPLLFFVIRPLINPNSNRPLLAASLRMVRPGHVFSLVLCSSLVFCLLKSGVFRRTGYTHDAQCVVYSGPDVKYRGREICFNYNEDTLVSAKKEGRGFYFLASLLKAIIVPCFEQSFVFLSLNPVLLFGLVVVAQTIVDVTDKSDVLMLSRTSYKGAQYTHQVGPAVHLSSTIEFYLFFVRWIQIVLLPFAFLVLVLLTTCFCYELAGLADP